MLESVDLDLLRNIFKCPTSTPSCVMYLDLQCIPIRFVLKKRRLIFVQYILQQDSNSLIYTFFEAQKGDSIKGDLVSQVMEDLEQLDIKLTFDQIKQYPKEKFKMMIKDKVNKVSYIWLIKEKEKLKSVQNIHYLRFEMQQYLVTDKLNTQQKRLLFHLRTKKLPLFNNRKFEHADGDLKCPFCRDDLDWEGHQLKCSFLVGNQSQIIQEKCDIYDIYSDNISKQITITLVFEAVYQKRKLLLQRMKI